MRRSGVWLALLGCVVNLAAAAPLARQAGVDAAYQRTGGALLWHRESALTPAGRSLLAELQAAEQRGLRPADYDAADLAQRAQGEHDADSRAVVDRELSDAAALLITHLQRGRVRPEQVGYTLALPPVDKDPAAALLALARSANLSAALDDYEPHYNHYELLKQGLARYRRLAGEPPFNVLPPLPQRSVKSGEPYASAAALRHMLRKLGDLDDTTPVPPEANDVIYDAALAAAVARFQSRHGLTADGVLGASTRAELVIPLTARVRQIELSMERARWLPAPDGPFILVNIPQFRLFAFRGPSDNENAMQAMNVIVGRSFPRHNTPVFRADMRYVVFQPYWDVPPSIVRTELLPKLRNSLSYADTQGYELVRGQSDESPVQPWNEANLESLARGELRVRQRPGPLNALGRVKFMFPNPFNVYLHSTPAQALFGRTERAFSHGCVRVENPQALGEFVFANEPGWDGARVAQMLDKQDGMKRINLKQPLRVMIFYATAVAAEDGRMLFFQDIYGHDAPLRRLLQL